MILLKEVQRFEFIYLFIYFKLIDFLHQVHV